MAAPLTAPATPHLTPTAAPARHRPAWALPLLIAAVLAVAVALVVGVRGLLADPVKETDASGVTTLEGGFQPFDCGSPCTGYVSAGARSVFVILPRDCAAPSRDAQVIVRGRLDTTQGRATYRAVACPTSP